MNTVRMVADSNGTATAMVQLIAKESQKACPADPLSPWYMLSGSWTRIRVTDAAHGLRLRPEDVVAGP